MYEGGPPKWNLFIKNCVFILTCLNVSQLQSTLHLTQYTYQDIFSTAQNSFWTRRYWCLLVPLPFVCLFVCFVSPLPHQQNASFWGLFSSRETKTSHSGQEQVNREGGHGGHAVCSLKLLNTECGVGRCACKSSMMKWVNMLSLQKIYSLKPNAASHNNTRWYTDVGFPEYSPSGESLYYEGLSSRR